ncbi:replication factor A protein [Trifolium medium]|uniref:Replication factor A protein n=1 Tax=Trifolium medium TaxID=97028 RepID=A0A392MU38_9FABA|nr:replication factor A protein [Trifolium medium]
MHPKKTVAELGSLHEDGVFAVCAQVVGIVDGQDWWYAACKCHKGVVPDSGAYFCTACDKHVFQVVPRVKIEVTDGKASSVFVIFDSEMSYNMEKSCAYFVAQSKARNVGPHPIEFDCLIGKKMLFAIDNSLKHPMVSDCSFRVKRICMNPVVIEEFCSQGPYFTPTKTMSHPIDLNSDGGSDESDVGEDSKSLEFLKDLIVTPQAVCENSDEKKEVGVAVKRNLSKAFDGAARRQGSRRLKHVKVKIEKE